MCLGLQGISCKNIAESSIARDEPEIFITLPEDNPFVNGYHIVAIYSDKTGYLWQINIPRPNEEKKPVIENLGEFKLPMDDEMLMCVRIDPVGWTATVSHDLSSNQRVVIATMSPSGTFRCWTTSISPKTK